MNRLLLVTILFSQISFGSDINYVFGWTQLNNPDLMIPRGGTSLGPEVDLDENPNPFWQQIQNHNLWNTQKSQSWCIVPLHPDFSADN